MRAKGPARRVLPQPIGLQSLDVRPSIPLTLGVPNSIAVKEIHMTQSTRRGGSRPSRFRKWVLVATVAATCLAVATPAALARPTTPSARDRQITLAVSMLMAQQNLTGHGLDDTILRAVHRRQQITQQAVDRRGRLIQSKFNRHESPQSRNINPA